MASKSIIGGTMNIYNGIRFIRPPKTLLKQDLVAFFSFNELSGNRVSSVDNSDVFTEVGGTVNSVAAVIGNGASGTSTATLSWDNSCFNYGDKDRTISFWHKSTTTSATTIFNTGNAAGALGEYLSLTVGSSTGSYLTKMYYSPTVSVLFPRALTNNIWSLVSVVIKNKNFILYRNNTWAARNVSSVINTTRTPFIFGPFSPNIIIDQVGFWNRALSLQEIVWLQNGTTGRTYEEILNYV